MLIYSNNFGLRPKGGPFQIIELIARWMGQRSHGFVDPKDLAQGVTRKRLRDGSTVTSRVTTSNAAAPTYPFLFSAELSHRDDQVSGRLWTTSIGVRQLSADEPVECTFLLKTDESSARVQTAVQVTRPRIVLSVVESCNPISETVGMKVKQLDESSADGFLAEVERESRTYPIVVVSALRDGTYLVQPEKLRSLLVGIADVVQVAPTADTFKIEKIVGKRYGAWGGAINVLYRTKTGRDGIYCDNSLYLADRLKDLSEAGLNLDSEILSTVTHQTNIPASWRHISAEVVAQAVLRRQLAEAVALARNTDDGAGYIPLLESAMDQLGEKDITIKELREDIQSRSDRIMELEASVQSLKYSLAGQRQAAMGPDDEGLDAILPLREAVDSLVTSNPTPEQSLAIIRTIFPDRVVVLDTAITSARESAGFQYGRKGFDLLWKLSTQYWTAVADGGGDAEGKKVFGQSAYAQNEGNALSNDGKRRRIFEYKGQDIVMEKHLRIGVKDSVAETLRIHFEWVGADRVIVIGHCGKHLSF